MSENSPIKREGQKGPQRQIRLRNSWFLQIQALKAMIIWSEHLLPLESVEDSQNEIFVEFDSSWSVRPWPENE